MKLRKEFDSIGSINVPDNKYWGASTERSNKFFNIGKILVDISIIKSIAIIKRSAAIVHAKDKQIKNNPAFSSEKINNLRYDLIKEELSELKDAMEKKDLLEVADALTDILYVTYGAGHAFGINLDKCFEEVQNSNMSKLDQNGKPIYNESGKVMKGPNYFKPDLSKFVS